MPYVQVIRGLKFAVRIEDMQAADVLCMTCTACGHGYRVAPHHLISRFPGFFKIIDVERFTVCRKCGTRGEVTWHIESARPPLDVVGGRDRV